MNPFAGAPLARWCVEAVALASDATTTAILSRQASQATARPRFVAYYLARVAVGMTYAEIGRAIGRRDHSTVLHGVRRARLLLVSDAAFAAMARRAALILLGRLEAHAPA